MGTAPAARDGIYDRYRCAHAMASFSEFTNTSPQPETVQCMRAPPICSREHCSPMTISAIRGEPKYMLAF